MASDGFDAPPEGAMPPVVAGGGESHAHGTASEPSLGPSQRAPSPDSPRGPHATPRAPTSKGGASGYILAMEMAESHLG